MAPDRLRLLLLWDVDGTLLRGGPAAGAAFTSSVAAVLGRPAEEVGRHGVFMGGLTDPQIALDILRALDVEDEAATAHLPAVLQGLVEHLAATADEIRAHGWVLPGVPAILARLAVRDDVVQTLLTGNLEANARLKVGAFDLDVHVDLDLGAYGDDEMDRRNLVPLAVDRVAKSYDRRFAPDEVWVIGDTPKDHWCAAAAGVRCLLVATGVVPRSELEGLGADFLLDDLSDTDTVERILTS